MIKVIRFAASRLVILLALALAIPSPAHAAKTTGDYRAELDSVALEMRALWGEIERFQIQQRYCLPPYAPLKQPDTMMMQAYSARTDALNDKYNALKQSLKDFLATNTRLHAELMIQGKDPTDPAWWTRWDASRDKMIAERNRKRDALAKKPERNCAPQIEPKVFVEPPPLVLPQRPQIPPFTWPDVPKSFCTELEKLSWRIANINPGWVREAEIAQTVARYRSQIESLVNDYVQAGKPVPPALAEARRQAIADSREMERVEKANADFYRRFAAVPVVDCGQGPRQSGMSERDFDRAEIQQKWIGEAESMIAEIDRLRRLGDCDAMYRLHEQLRQKLSIMREVVVDQNEPQRRRAFPPETIEELRRRAEAARTPCPPPGFKSQAQILDEARKAYHDAAQGNDPRAFDRAKETLLRELDEEIATETRDVRSDQLIRERTEVRTGELPRTGIIDEIEPPRVSPQPSSASVGMGGGGGGGLRERREVPMAIANLTGRDLEKLSASRDLSAVLRGLSCPSQTTPTFVRTVAPAPGMDSRTLEGSLTCVRPSDLRMIDVLKEHNRVRTAFGAQPLVWDNDLANGAAQYAMQMPRLGLNHSPRTMRPTDVRENLQHALRGGSGYDLTRTWVGESRYFVPGVFPNVSSNGNWTDVAHYTQMVWPTTTRVGCGSYVSGGDEWFVCRYSGPGNRDGTAIAPMPIADEAPLPRINLRDFVREKLGGGMTQIDPPAGTPPAPPPPPTAEDPAPNGDEMQHPLRNYFTTALTDHQRAFNDGNLNGQAEALAKMYYALQELVKRMRDAQKLPPNLRNVDPAKVKQLIDTLNKLYREANERSRPRDQRPSDSRDNPEERG